MREYFLNSFCNTRITDPKPDKDTIKGKKEAYRLISIMNTDVKINKILANTNSTAYLKNCTT